MKKFPKPWFRPSRNRWFVTLNGRQINLGSDKDTAFERYKALLSKPQTASVCGEKLVSVIDRFLEWCLKHRSPHTYEWYRYRLQRFVDRYPKLDATRIQPFHVQEWVDSYELSKTSQRNYIRSVKRCLSWAVAQGYLEKNPLEHMRAPSAEPRERFVTAGEYEHFLSFVRCPHLKDLLEVTWETGCRPQESLRVEVRHFDERNQRWVFPRAESKGRRAPRVVYLTDKAMTVTRRRVAQLRKGRIFRNTAGNPWTTSAVNCALDRVQIRMGQAVMRETNDLASEAEIERAMDQVTLTKRVKGKIVKRTQAELRQEAKRIVTSAKAKSLVPRYSLYSLRHSWATRALQSGTDALTVAILMGHSDPSTLAKVYQHLSHNPEHLLSQARRVS